MKSYGGLIRWKFGLPLSFGILALVLFTFLLLDQQLRWVMEKPAFPIAMDFLVFG